MLAQYDKAAVAQRFTRKAAEYSEHAQVQQITARYLFGMLEQAKNRGLNASVSALAGTNAGLSATLAATSNKNSNTYDTLLDLGCGPGVNSAALAMLAKQYIGVDISAGMLAAAVLNQPPQQRFHHDPAGSIRYLQADMEQLPLADQSIAAIYSNFAVQWSNRPPQLLQEIARVLKPGGVAAFSTVLNGSLEPFATLRHDYLQRSGVNSQATLLEWQHWLRFAGLRIATVEQKQETVWFADVKQIVRSISRIGADLQRENAAPALTSLELRSLKQKYELYRGHSGLPLKYEVGYLLIYK